MVIVAALITSNPGAGRPQRTAGQPLRLLDDVSPGWPEDHQVIENRRRVAGPVEGGELVPAAAAHPPPERLEPGCRESKQLLFSRPGQRLFSSRPGQRLRRRPSTPGRPSTSGPDLE